MKKIFFILAMVVVLSGCSNIKKSSIDSLVNESLSSKTHTNVVKVGYKFYKPSMMSLLESYDYNEILRNNGYLYYLYIDVVSYYNKSNNTYEENDISYYSKKIEHNGNTGYIEINEINDKEYLIEIMYNYAKIEVMVDKYYIKDAVSYSLSILSSIKYNDEVIKSVVGSDVLNTYEESIDIFKTKTNDTNHLKFVEENKYDKDVIPDMDLVN